MLRRSSPPATPLAGLTALLSLLLSASPLLPAPFRPAPLVSEPHADPAALNVRDARTGEDGRSEQGRILGRVVDAATGQPLPGAHVQLGAGPRATVAGVEGRFQLDRVPAGPVELRVTLIGYAARTRSDVQVEPGSVTHVDVTLEPAALALAGITVTGQTDRGSTVAALSEQRSALSIVNAISSEQISRSADGDAAAAVRRVSGVSVQDGKYVFVRGLGERYTTSSLNGARIPSPEPERKVVPLDLFPTSLLEAIRTSKTFTPDQPGDFSGGSVDIRTPQFPARRTFHLSLSTGYQPGVTGGRILRAPQEGGERLALGVGNRALPEPAANFPATASRGPEVNRVVNSFRNAWSVQEGAGELPASLGASLGGSLGVGAFTLGYLGSFTYSAGQEARLGQRRARVGTGETERDRFDGESATLAVLWGGLLNVSALVGSHTQIQLNNTYNRSADNEARRETGVDENTRATVQIDRLTYIERWVRSSQLLASHQLGARHRLDWALTSTGVSRAEPDRSEFVRWLDPERPIWFNDFEGAVRTFGALAESSLEGSARYAFAIGGDRGSPHRVTLGGVWRQTERDTWSRGFRIQAFEWASDDPRWQAPPEEFFDGRHAGNGDAVFLLSPELSGGSYAARDRLLAGFLMGEASPTSRLRLVGGVRMEGYRLEVDSENQLGQPARTARDYLDLLPSLAATVRLTEAQQLRLSASRTLARPEYRELAPITYREVLGGEQVIGNVELVRTLVRSLDARWEWYPGAGEVISLGVFTKAFEAPIEQRYLARSGTDTRTFINAESATNRGVEVEAVKRLGGLSEPLAPLSLFSNLTVMRSRVRVGAGDPERAMVGQAPFVVNSGLTWSGSERAPSGTLLYNVVGKRIVNARASGSQVADVVERPRHLVDLSLRFPLPGGASGKLDLKNLLDAPYQVVQGPVVREYHTSGRSASLGVSWRW